MIDWNKINTDRYYCFINKIISERGAYNVREPYEVHHIIPRSFGGLPKRTNHSAKHDNLVWLSLEEHYEAHKILALDNIDNYKIVFAFRNMSCTRNGSIIDNSDDYKKLREAFVDHNRQIHIGKPSGMKGKHFDSCFKDKISKSIAKKWEDENYRNKVKKGMTGRTPWNKGTVGEYSEEYKRKLSDAKIGKKLSEEHRLHIGKSSIGRVKSQEVKEKISKSQSGEKCKRNRGVLCIETGVEYYNAKYASECLNINHGNLVQVCRGNRKSINGLHFRYTE